MHAEIYFVIYFLIDCIDLGIVRLRFYTVPDMNTLFGNITVDRILSFVKQVNLFAELKKYF